MSHSSELAVASAVGDHRHRGTELGAGGAEGLVGDGVEAAPLSGRRQASASRRQKPRAAKTVLTPNAVRVFRERYDNAVTNKSYRSSQAAVDLVDTWTLRLVTRRQQVAFAGVELHVDNGEQRGSTGVHPG
jgi:hypothetical protein